MAEEAQAEAVATEVVADVPMAEAVDGFSIRVPTILECLNIKKKKILGKWLHFSFCCGSILSRENKCPYHKDKRRNVFV